MPLNEQHPPETQELLPLDAGDDDYEVITSEEVDHVLDVLDQLINEVESENIRAFLEEAADGIFNLVYSEESEDHAEAA